MIRREQLKESQQQTVFQMLNDIAETICNHYCKYADRYFEEEEELIKYCWECPLNRLGN